MIAETNFLMKLPFYFWSVVFTMSEYSIRNFAVTTGNFLKFIGLATFSLRDDKVVVTPFDVACLVFNVLIGFFVFHFSLIFGIERFANSSILLTIGVLLTMVSGSVVIIISKICVFWHRHRIWKLVSMLERALVKIKRIKVVADFKRYIVMFSVFAMVTVFLVLFGIIIMAGWLGYSNKIQVLLIYGYLSISFSASMGWSSMFHLGIYLRLNLINQTIR